MAVKTLLLSVRDFELPKADRAKGPKVASSAALIAAERFAQDTGAAPWEVKVCNVGEIVHPDPSLKGAGRQVICPPHGVEVNQSPPGPAVEYPGTPAGVRDAVDAYRMPDLLRELNRTLTVLMAENGKALPILIKGQSALLEAFQQQATVNQAILETMQSLSMGVPSKAQWRTT